MTLREAFAKSINTVFGKLAAFILKPEELENYAGRFRFNKGLSADFPVQTGRFSLGDRDTFKLAELGSGFNRVTQISPIQGALMAAAIANEGKIMAPYLVDSLKNDKSEIVYEAKPMVLSDVMSKASAEHMRELMRETVVRGTSRKAFGDYIRRPKANQVEVGGKTGSLKDEILRGKCDWFVGYGMRGSRKIAVAVLTVHETLWRVKSSTLARLFLEKYLDTSMDKSLMNAEEEEDFSPPVDQK
jgi:cell division protein FtsI/penicillin-binding protein 2